MNSKQIEQALQLAYREGFQAGFSTGYKHLIEALRQAETELELPATREAAAGLADELERMRKNGLAVLQEQG